MATNGREYCSVYGRQLMKNSKFLKASEQEKNYVQALSRESVIEAYANWKELSVIEQQCIDMFLMEKSRVLDLGCGAGRIPRIFGDRLGSYLGVDCSPEMVSLARKLNPKFKFVCEDFLESSYTELRFDTVLLMNNVLDMLHPFERRQEAFSLVKSLLDPNGVLIYSSHLLNDEGTSGYNKEDYHGAFVNTYRSSFWQLCKEAESCGFEIKLAARDYRYQVADWAYIVAKVTADS